MVVKVVMVVVDLQGGRTLGNGLVIHDVPLSGIEHAEIAPVQSLAALPHLPSPAARRDRRKLHQCNFQPHYRVTTVTTCDDLFYILPWGSHLSATHVPLSLVGN